MIDVPLHRAEHPSTHTIYEVATGKILRTYEGPPGSVWQQLKDGEAAIDGDWNPLCTRIENGLPIEFEPSPPGSDVQWSAAQKRFVPTAQAREREAARLRIIALESQQARAIREEHLGRGGTPAELKKRLEAIDDQIIALRAIVNS